MAWYNFSSHSPARPGGWLGLRRSSRSCAARLIVLWNHHSTPEKKSQALLVRSNQPTKKGSSMAAYRFTVSLSPHRACQLREFSIHRQADDFSDMFFAWCEITTYSKICLSTRFSGAWG